MASLAKRFAELQEQIDAHKPVEGDGIDIEETPTGAIISVEPEPPPLPFRPIVLTAGPDSAGFYTCNVYGDGTTMPVTAIGAYAWIWGLYVDATTTPQGLWLARPIVTTVNGSDAEVWEVFPNIPIVPDSTYTYFLVAIAGIVQWVKAGDCDAAASASGA